jgi:hypothetical protein
LASAKSAQDYQQLIDRYPNRLQRPTLPFACGNAARREEIRGGEHNASNFIAKYPQHEFVNTARMAMAGNLQSMGKTDEGRWRSTSRSHRRLLTASMRLCLLISQVFILKENRNDDARHVCETILTQYRSSFWAGEAMQQLRLLKPSTSPSPPPISAQNPAIPPLLARPAAPAPPPAPPAPPSPKKP